ncbi:MAG: thiamine pyrophosphate-dependent enzyme [Bdellovibrionota bacterium]
MPKKKPAAFTVDNETLLSAYKEMLRARKVDEKAIVLYKQNKCHFQIGCAGHEAVQVAAAHAMKPGHDWAYPYYRDMGFVAAWGMTNRELLLGILNKAEDPNSGGRMMPMHYGHKDLRIVNQSSPTGTQFLQAVGAAKGAVYRGLDEIVYVSSGEGTTAQGSYYEAINWAARERLPVIFLIQDNAFAISVHKSEQFAGASVSAIAKGFTGLDVVDFNGLDYIESRKVFDAAVERARSGDGPSLLVAEVVRLQSHSISDNQSKYRSAKEIAKDRDRDPLALLRKELIERGAATKKDFDQFAAEIQKQVDADAEWAEAQPDPAPETCETHVFVDLDPGANIVEAEPNGESVFLVEALNFALDEEMRRNPEMVIYGQDVAFGKGGVFTVTTGLTAKYGAGRVFNSPLAEASIAGTAIGLATVGLKPVVEIQFGDYVWTAMMDIRNELSNILYRSNGTFPAPAVIRIPIGGYIHGGLYHSQNIEATFSHFPGLNIVLPSNAWDAKGLLKAAIRGNDPVLFLEHKGLYRQVYAKGPRGGMDDLVPLGRAKVVRAGSDATIVTWGAIVQKSLLAAEALAKSSGASVEVIDLRSIYPLDTQTILESVKRTGRLLVAHEDVLFMGFGAEIAARVAEDAFEHLDAPVKRVGGKFTPIPHAPTLEKAVLPQTEDVERALRELLRY